MSHTQDKSPQSVLVVDDDEITRSIIAKVIEAEGYAVYQASDGEAAIKLCKGTPIDLAILDIQMPGLDGIEVARRIDPLPVLFLSQIDDQNVINSAIAQRALGPRAVGYVVKPIDKDNIITTVKSALGIASELNEKQRLLESVTRSLESEKRQLAREIHDQLGQELLGIRVDATAIVNAAKALPEIQEKAQRIISNVEAVHKTVSAIIHSLYPEDLDTLGLRESLAFMVSQWDKRLQDCAVDLEIKGEIDHLGPDINVAIYRITQEALTNVGKYAQAKRVLITLRRRSRKDDESYLFATHDIVQLNIKDDGAGIDLKTLRPGIGLRGMQERAKVLGGSFKVESNPGEGTCLSILIPL